MSPSMGSPSIYIKAKTSEQLILGEGICGQLKIIRYHPDIVDRKGRDQQKQARLDGCNSEEPALSGESNGESVGENI